MSSNPYAFDDFNEEDLEELSSMPSRPKQKHVLDGSPCPACGVPHDVIGAEDVPEEVLEQVSRVFDNMPEDVAHSQLIVTHSQASQLKLLQEFAEFARRVTKLRRTNPILRAVAETLDELTSGDVSRKWRLYEAELDLQVAHILLRTLDSIQEAFNERGPDNPEEHERVETLLGKLYEASQKRLDASVKIYRKCCVITDRKIDPKLIEEGNYSDDPNHDFTQHTKMTADRLVQDFIHNDED